MRTPTKMSYTSMFSSNIIFPYLTIRGKDRRGYSFKEEGEQLSAFNERATFNAWFDAQQKYSLCDKIVKSRYLIIFFSSFWRAWIFCQFGWCGAAQFFANIWITFRIWLLIPQLRQRQSLHLLHIYQQSAWRHSSSQQYDKGEIDFFTKWGNIQQFIWKVPENFNDQENILKA